MCVAVVTESEAVAKFVDQPDERLTCPICKRVFDEPWQTSCGHRFCKNCLEPLLRYFTIKHYPTGLFVFLQKFRFISLSFTLSGYILVPRILASHFCFILHNATVEH